MMMPPTYSKMLTEANLNSSPGITVTSLLSGAPRAGIDSEHLNLAMTARERSWSSLTQVILLYVSMALRANVTQALYRRIMNRFIMLMILPAGINHWKDYAYQNLTGLTDPFNLEQLFPKSILTSGFFYNVHYPGILPLADPMLSFSWNRHLPRHSPHRPPFLRSLISAVQGMSC